MPNDDLISRKALIEQIEEDAKNMMFTSHHSRMLHDDMVEFAINAIECAPAVDAVEVVRCKDCKFSRPLKSIPRYRYCVALEDVINSSGDFYCARGAKMENPT